MRTTVPSVRTLVLICFLTALSVRSQAQGIMSADGKYEIGIALGPMFFLGDLGGHYGEGRGFVKDLNLPLTKLSKGIYANVYPVEWFGFRAGFNHGIIEGYDNIINEKGGAERHRKERNLNFKSTIMEFYAAAEFLPTVFIEQYDGLEGKLRPYGVMGIGAFKFNPMAGYGGAWIPLKPLRLEGQGMEETGRKEYSLIQIEVPVGFGAKYYIKDNLYIGMEVLHRKTFTDYIDDVSTTYIDANLFDKYLTPDQAQLAKALYYRSNEVTGTTRPPFPSPNEQRGDAAQKDAYFSGVLRLGWRLNDWNSPNGRAARQLRCPSFY